MLAKTLLAAVATVVIASGSMALTGSAAMAHDGYGAGYYVTKVVSVPKTVTKTYYRTVLAGYDDCYRPIYKKVAYSAQETIYVDKYVRVFVPATDYGYDDAPSYEAAY